MIRQPFALQKDLEEHVRRGLDQAHTGKIIQYVINAGLTHDQLVGVTSDQHHAQQHALVSSNHIVSGLTPGHFLKALTASTFGFAAHGLVFSDLGTVTLPLTYDGNEDNISIKGLNSIGTANFIPGVNAAGDTWEMKELVEGINQKLSIEHAANSVTFSVWAVPQPMRPSHQKFFACYPNHTLPSMDSIGQPGTSASGLTLFGDDVTLWARISTSTVSSSTAYVHQPNLMAAIQHKIDWTVLVRTDPSAITDVRYWFGLINSAAGVSFGDDPASTHEYAMFRFSTNVPDSNWICKSRDGSTTQSTDSGVAVSADTIYELRIITTGTSIKFYINGNLVATHTTNIPAASTRLAWYAWVQNISGGGAGTARLFDLSYQYAEIDAGVSPSGGGGLGGHTHIKADITDTPWAWSDVGKTGSNLNEIVTRSHTVLSDIGTLTHATIDSYLDQSVKQAASPIHPTIKLSNLTDNYIPYHVSDAVGLANSPVAVLGTYIGVDGITFPAVAVPSADVNTIDDYREGTWTLGISFGGGTTGITYSVNTGSFIKIGPRVFFNGRLQLTSKGSSVGDALITGLPYTCKNDGRAYSAVSLLLYDITYANAFQGYVSIGTTIIILSEVTEAGAYSLLTNADFSNISGLMVSGHYEVE